MNTQDHRTKLIAKARSAAERRSSTASVQSVAYHAMPFDQLAQYRNLEKMRKASSIMGIDNPFFRSHGGRASNRTMIAGREVINFASYDYVGLNSDPRPVAKAHAALDRYGVSPSASRLVAGERPVHAELEAALARHYGTSAAIAFVSGHATNVATIGELMGEGDLILHDAYIHNSVQVGARLSGAARRSFAHNDMAALEAMLEENRPRARNALIVVEGLYSMDGDTPPLAELVALKRKYGCWLMVDEAHALGVVGARGRGCFEAAGVSADDVDIWMGTLSKTLASAGGYVCGSAALIDILKSNASGFVYSVGLAPALAASATEALAILEAEPERVSRLQANAKLFLRLAAEAGLDTGLAEPYAVIPIMVGDSMLAAKLSERMLARGVNALPIIFPAVPMQSARLRFFISSLHEESDIRTAVHVVGEELEKLHQEDFHNRLPAHLLSI